MLHIFGAKIIMSW